ncbi:MAG: NADH-quinone oxidoreductase subunit J [Alphaproteobacteria bacterium]|nr:NADH-quinone oxidoreductase subunit J [Alphaproteobacteria bacterium]
MIEAVFFYVFATVLVLSAIGVITARNPVHSVLFLILAFFNAAGLFVMLGAEFIAMIMVIVYVGAVAVLFLFVVMMLDINFAELRKGMMKHAPVGALVGFALLAEFTWMFKSWSPSSAALNGVAQPIPDQAAISNTHALGEILYTQYVYLFQISGLILLVAMVGAITLTLRRRPDSRRQSVAGQISRRPEDVLKVEKITSGTGVF